VANKRDLPHIYAPRKTSFRPLFIFDYLSPSALQFWRIRLDQGLDATPRQVPELPETTHKILTPIIPTRQPQRPPSFERITVSCLLHPGGQWPRVALCRAWERNHHISLVRLGTKAVPLGSIVRWPFSFSSSCSLSPSIFLDLACSSCVPSLSHFDVARAQGE
jgi:hypothetical protein